ncbi:hypothetical protein ACTU3I_08820 [Microbacterium sp. RD1]|uniref:hypothetical protein n=1 Tax=Microbacterium sp. RD1 TaxID=3457313 RepID=UPI003FA55492
MKTIVYAGDRLVTGDEVAIATMNYSRALADAGTAATVEIPVIGPDGFRTTAVLLIGPASQIVAESGPENMTELIDDDVVAELQELTRRLEPSAGPETSPPADLAWTDEL